MIKKCSLVLFLSILLVSCALEPSIPNNSEEITSSKIETSISLKEVEETPQQATITPSFTEEILDNINLSEVVSYQSEEPEEVLQTIVETSSSEESIVEEIIEEAVTPVESSTEEIVATPTVTSSQKDITYINYSAPLNNTYGTLVTIYYKMWNNLIESRPSTWTSVSYGSSIEIPKGANSLIIYAIDEDGYEWGQSDKPIVNPNDSFEFIPAMLIVDLGVDIDKVTVTPPMFSEFTHKDYSEGTTLKYMFKDFRNHRMVLTYDDGVNVYSSDHLFTNTGKYQIFTIEKGSRLSLVNTDSSYICTEGSYTVLEVGGKEWTGSANYIGIALEDEDWILGWNREDGETDEDTSMLIHVDLSAIKNDKSYKYVEDVFVPGATWLKQQITWTEALN